MQAFLSKIFRWVKLHWAEDHSIQCELNSNSIISNFIEVMYMMVLNLPTLWYQVMRLFQKGLYRKSFHLLLQSLLTLLLWSTGSNYTQIHTTSYVPFCNHHEFKNLGQSSPREIKGQPFHSVIFSLTFVLWNKFEDTMLGAKLLYIKRRACNGASDP